jgi:hypothetical protein
MSIPNNSSLKDITCESLLLSLPRDCSSLERSEARSRAIDDLVRKETERVVVVDLIDNPSYGDKANNKFIIPCSEISQEDLILLDELQIMRYEDESEKTGALFLHYIGYKCIVIIGNTPTTLQILESTDPILIGINIKEGHKKWCKYKTQSSELMKPIMNIERNYCFYFHNL